MFMRAALAIRKGPEKPRPLDAASYRKHQLDFLKILVTPVADGNSDGRAVLDSRDNKVSLPAEKLGNFLKASTTALDAAKARATAVTAGKADSSLESVPESEAARS